MYRTTSVLALGLFFGLAPIGALAQTDDTQLQTDTQAQTDTQTQTDTMQTDDQQATETEVEMTTDDDAMQTDDRQATDTDTMQSDDQQATETEVDITTDDDAEMTTDTQTETTTGDDAEMTTDTQTETTTGDDAEVVTETETESTTGDDADMAATDTEEVPEVIPEQDTSEMLGSSLMGASVNLADEEIGTVSDLIIADDHTVRGVVVGVGGFLGIGEKRVALPVERLTIRATEPGEVEISTDMTREELEQQEAFKTAAQVRSEEEAAQAQQDAEMQQPAAPAVPAE